MRISWRPQPAPIARTDDCGGSRDCCDNVFAIVAHPGDDAHEDMLAWLGMRHTGKLGPDAVDPCEVRTRLRAMPAAR